MGPLFSFILFQKEVIQFIANLDKKSDLIEANKKAEKFIKSYEKFDYFEFRNASNLSLEGSLDDARLFYAIYKSGIRLIDNLDGRHLILPGCCASITLVH